ncbi:HAD family hydrolase [Sporosarcina sp. 179-K 3D1 HS]|uniref:HAD family hydrolase n=1 Tax=Sporosarcina sp. 179-K 3D1 HS TaxID=3232169 RepID=UPI0039A3E6A3
MKVIVFDMDDTLYDEYTYVRSGFYEVASFLSSQIRVNPESLFEWMWQRLQSSGRGAIFDDLLKEFDCYSKKLARKCLSVYRFHNPEISLSKEAVFCLEQLKDFPLYLVTDGNKIVQHKKAQALGLYERMKHCYITHRYGVERAKPSPYCFLHLLKKENVEAADVVYIGDNPTKDFVGIKPLGFRTIRVMIGQHKEIKVAPEYEAEFNINSLTELPMTLVKIWPEIKEVIQ